MYDDYKWRGDTDYLFLRNNVPDFGKLKKNLLVKKGNVGYMVQMFSEIAVVAQIV